jgi:hypothetical protein
MTLGRPLALNTDDFDVQMPSISTEATTLDESPDTNETQCPQQAAKSTLPIFIHFVQHMAICGNIMRLLHGLKPIDGDGTMLIARRNRLIADLDQWRENTADLMNYICNVPGEMTSSSSSSSCFRCREWYEVLYHNAILLALRPSPMTTSGSDDASLLQDSWTLQRIFESSQQAVRLYAHLYDTKRLNYSWITLHSVFMAGLSYIYAVADHFRTRRKEGNANTSQKSLSQDPTVVEIVTDTRACSNILVAVSERWNLTKRCHKVFDRLSDAILAEAVNFKPQLPAESHVAPAGRDAAARSHQQHDGQDHRSSLAQYHHSHMPPLVGSNNHGNSGLDHRWFTDGSTPPTDTMTSATDIFNPQLQPPPILMDVDSEFRNCLGDLLSSYTSTDDPFSISELDFQTLHGWPTTASGWF